MKLAEIRKRFRESNTIEEQPDIVFEDDLVLIKSGQLGTCEVCKIDRADLHLYRSEKLSIEICEVCGMPRDSAAHDMGSDGEQVSYDAISEYFHDLGL